MLSKSKHKEISRRKFLAGSASTAAGVVAATAARSFAAPQGGRSVIGANERLNAAVIGIRGQGGGHVNECAERKDICLKTICDVDERLFRSRLKNIEEKQGSAPATEYDLRRVYDDKEIDIVCIATPNHWHALATIWACQAGKDVYVEKPASHNVFEGRKMVEAARKYKRVVQHGTQIRSSGGILEAVQKLREGVIGEVYMARGLCFRWRGSIGKRRDEPVPSGVHYDIWLGPAPNRPFSRNRFHYNWHWHWDYGNGDIDNQGVHQMDIARWGLGVGLPKRVTSMGGNYLWDDDKEIPNVINTSFDYPDAGKKGKMLVFDTRPWCTNGEKGAKVGVIFYGSEGYMVIDSYSHYETFLGKEGEEEKLGPSLNEGGDHFGNFLKAVRARQPELLNAEIEEGHLSAALCHLGLISARLGRSLEFDPEKEDFVGDEEASKLISRKYREPFVVPKEV